MHGRLRVMPLNPCPCECGGMWRVLCEAAWAKGFRTYPFVKCPDNPDVETSLLGLVNPQGTWQLQHQSAGSDDWKDIVKNDEIKKSS